MSCCFIPLTVLAVSNQNTEEFIVGSFNIKNQEHIQTLQTAMQDLQTIQILGLQEVSIEEAINGTLNFNLQNITKKYWTYQCLHKTNRIKLENWEGQIILSQFPILKCGYVNLQSTDPKTRIAQWAVIQISQDLKILFVNTDHETNNRLTLGFPDRKKQLYSLMNYLSQCETYIDVDCTNWVKVIVGDFNTLGFSVTSPIATFNEVVKTEKFMVQQNFVRVQPCPNQGATFSSWLGDYELDHIFIEQGFSTTCRSVDYKFLGSDHFPIWSTLSIM